MMAKETKMLKNEEAKKLGKPATKGLKAAETKKTAGKQNPRQEKSNIHTKSKTPKTRCC